jgi:hypothetical protein
LKVQRLKLVQVVIFKAELFTYEFRGNEDEGLPDAFNVPSFASLRFCGKRQFQMSNCTVPLCA